FPVVQIRLIFVSQTEIEREISFRVPIIAHEYANVLLIYPNRRSSRIHRELRRAPAQSPDLIGGKVHALEQEGAAVSLNGIDVHEFWLSRWVEHWLVLCIQFGC